VKVWYDPKTLKLLKRYYQIRERDGGPVRSTLVETYDDFALDVDIPDEKFKLPEEKK